MKSADPRIPILAAAIVALIPAAVRSAQQPPAAQEPIRTGARTVAVYATVTDKGGRLVPDLGREAFEVRDNGKPRALTVFSNEIQPITIVMMLDRSGSMRGNFGLVERAAGEFVQRLRPDDKARVGIFADRIEIEPEGFSSNREELLGILQSDMPVTGPTPLWNALDQAITAVREQEGRKVVLVFSDGSDAPGFGFNNRSVMDIMRRAQQDDVMVYAIGLQTTMLTQGRGFGGFGRGMGVQRPDPALAAVAEQTGGGYFELTRADDLAATFARVVDELHRQYALGFEPAKLDDKMHKLDVRVNTSGMKVRARKEYFARRE